MQIKIHRVKKAMILIVLPVAAVVSCNPNNSKDTSPKAEATSMAETEKAADAKMTFEQFNEGFIAILKDKGLMNSATTGKVDDLCLNLTPQLLSKMLELAAIERPTGVSEETWLLGYNQLMAMAGSMFGKEVTAAFHRLAANPAAHPVMRDYASQHYLRTETLILGRMGEGKRDEHHSRLEKVLDESMQLVTGADAEAGTLPGAVLMGLSSLYHEHKKDQNARRLIQSKVAGIIIPLLENRAGQSDSTICGAMQAAGHLQLENAKSVILEIAMDKSATNVMRINAIGSLGHFSNLAAIEDLRKSIHRNNKQLMRACENLEKSLANNSKSNSK